MLRRRSRLATLCAVVAATRTVDARAGANTVTLTARQLGRRAGLYRVTARFTDGGASQATHVRIARRSRW